MVINISGPDSLRKQHHFLLSQVPLSLFHHTDLLRPGSSGCFPGFCGFFSVGFSKSDTPVSGFQLATKVQQIRHCGRAVKVTDKKSVAFAIDRKSISLASTGSNPVDVFCLNFYFPRGKKPNPGHKNGINGQEHINRNTQGYMVFGSLTLNSPVLEHT